MATARALSSPLGVLSSRFFPRCRAAAHRSLWALSLGLLLGAGSASAATDASAYATQGRCAGYPRIDLQTPKGWCVGLVADARDGLKMPRRLLEVSPGRFWITDMGNWEPRRGRLLALDVAGQPGEPSRVTALAAALDRPHALLRGPDGLLYVGEAGVVWRTPLAPAAPLVRETVVDGLPAEGAHPLTELAFVGHERLLINVGSATDACRDERQQQPMPCPELAGPAPRAAVYEMPLQRAPGQPAAMTPLATGLRNSLGLAATRGAREGEWRLWQAENSVDYHELDQPAEELNELVRGAHYGWPYCLSDARGRQVPARGYEQRAHCQSAYQRAPAQIWPAHVAPLQLLVVPPAAQGQAPTPWSGRLLAVWHGYRPAGHRIVAWRLDAEGRPSGEREDIVWGWDAKPGVRPLGSPAGVTVDHLGRLWIVEDRNRTVLVVAPE